MSEASIEMYAQPLFYFFLRKVGNAADAEDLAADVLLALLHARRTGRAIEHPHAWVWRVARNRYAAWADGKRRAEVPLDESAPDESDLLADAMHQDDLLRLRRELAFIGREHRELIVAHYLRQERLQDIAARLGMPLGTVKARLHRCRAKIREGMEMAKQYGPRSFDPERIDYSTSGNQPTDLPDSALRRRIVQNILLEASENPCTIDELSMALGVAAPYMEDEVRDLVRATLLKQAGDKYVTDFFIMSGETATRLRTALREMADAHTGPVRAIAADVLPLVKALHPDNARQSDNALLWWLLPWVHEAALFTEPRYRSDFPPRACGPEETWGIVGYEKVESPAWEPCFMGRCAISYRGGMSGIYRYDHENEALWARIGPMSDAQATLLLSLVQGQRKLSSLTDTEEAIWRSLDGKYAHAEGDDPVMDVVVLPHAGRATLDAAIRRHAAFPALQAATTAAFDRLMALLSLRMGGNLAAQREYVASMELSNLRMMVLHDCLRAGDIFIPENVAATALGLWIEAE